MCIKAAPHQLLGINFCSNEKKTNLHVCNSRQVVLAM